MKSSNLFLAALIAASTSGVARSGPTDPALQPSAADTPPALPAPTTGLTEGEVRKVDKDAGKVTLRHGPIANLDMPAMTMAFRVADPKMLDGLQPGDKVRFRAERVNGAIMVTGIGVVK